ncbi:MAG: methionyl-tRNA formyltransferase, partial [Myxococcales bacterium]|nr:methionyl-tRNA formyltransferase [Myxococcales bacterium]
HARGMRPWPGAETTLDGERLKILRCVALDESADEVPGEIVRASAEGIDVATGVGILRLLEVQLPGKKPITAAQLVSSRNDLVGRTLGLDADITSA